MDVLVDLLNKYGFKRVNSGLSIPIIVHCVPGAGKSSCIRELIQCDSRFKAYTLGIEDPQNLQGVRIEKYKGQVEESQLNILDEYTLEPTDLSKFYVCFGDPIQTDCAIVKPADFICNESRRFGRATAQLLRDLGFDVTSNREDSVQIAGIYEVDPRDTVIYYETEVGCLLKSHQVEAHHIKEIIGKTFDSVTFVTTHNGVDHEGRAASFQCLSRHRKSLLILCPNATYRPA